MTNTTTPIIPVLDLREFTEGEAAERQAFVHALGEAFHRIGFANIQGHQIPRTLIDGFYSAAKAFFALSAGEKAAYQLPGMAGQRGYTAFGTEHARHSDVPDLKEFFQIGQYDIPEDMRDYYPENVVVQELPVFNHYARELFRAFETTGRALLRAIALYLDLEEDYFEDKVRGGNSILRAIHYPPIQQEPASAIRADQHEDINLITLLVGASAGGLELLSKEEQWLPIVPAEDEIVINVGDMLQRLTNNYLKSTTHRVVNPPRAEWHLPRLSIPFFLHPRYNMDLTALPGCVTESQPPVYAPITAGAYLEERLKEIGLKK